jgi:glycine/sarcosine/betaine reductase complex component A
MDLDSQERILKLSETHGASSLVVIIGAPDPEAAEITAETVTQGDPSYAGALAGAQLGLDVYHILDDTIRSEIPDDVWEAQIGVMADVLDAGALAAAVAGMRDQGGGGAS